MVSPLPVSPPGTVIAVPGSGVAAALTLGAAAGSEGVLAVAEDAAALGRRAVGDQAHDRVLELRAGLLRGARRRHGRGGRGGRRILREEERHRHERADQQHGHRKESALDELAPDVLEGFLRVHRVAPVTVAGVVGTVGPPAGAGVVVCVAAGPAGVAPTVTPCVSGTR